VFDGFDELTTVKLLILLCWKIWCRKHPAKFSVQNSYR